MRARSFVALLGLVASLSAGPAYAGPVDSCTAFALPPRQEGGFARGEGGVLCGGTPRAAVTVEVCVNEFAYFAGFPQLGCATTTATGNLVVGSVTVCPEPDFPLLQTRVTATTDRGEAVDAVSVLSPGFCTP